MIAIERRSSGAPAEQRTPQPAVRAASLAGPRARYAALNAVGAASYRKRTLPRGYLPENWSRLSQLKLAICKGPYDVATRAFWAVTVSQLILCISAVDGRYRRRRYTVHCQAVRVPSLPLFDPVSEAGFLQFAQNSDAQ